MAVGSGWATQKPPQQPWASVSFHDIPAYESRPELGSDNPSVTTYTVPAYYDLDITTESSANSSEGRFLVSVRVLPSMMKTSVLGAAMMGIPLVPDVAYYLESDRRYCIFCQHDAQIEVSGKPRCVLILPNNAAKRLKVISSILRNQRYHSLRLLDFIVKQGPAGPLAFERLSSVSELERDPLQYRGFVDQIRGLIFSGSPQSVCAPRVLVVGRGSFGIAQSLYGWGQQDEHFPTYVELDPVPQLASETLLGSEACVFPPGCIGLATGHASWGLRSYVSAGIQRYGTSVVKQSDTVEYTLVSLLADKDHTAHDPNDGTDTSIRPHSNIALNFMPQVPTGRLCYFLGHGLSSGTPAVYRHYMRLIAGSIIFQTVACLQTALTSQMLETTKEQERYEALAHVASGLIVHAPEQLAFENPGLLEDLLSLFHINVILVSDHPRLADHLSSRFCSPLHVSSNDAATNPIKSITVVSVSTLDRGAIGYYAATSESHPNQPSAVPHRTLSSDECCEKGWASYFFGPLETRAISDTGSTVRHISRGLQLPTELTLSVSSLQFVTFQASDTNDSTAQPLKETLNGITSIPLVIGKHVRLMDLAERVVAVVSGDNDSLVAAACIPVSCFVWIKQVVPHPLDTTDAADWQVTVVSSVPLTADFLEAPSTFCILAIPPHNATTSLDRFRMP